MKRFIPKPKSLFPNIEGEIPTSQISEKQQGKKHLAKMNCEVQIFERMLAYTIYYPNLLLQHHQSICIPIITHTDGPLGH